MHYHRLVRYGNPLKGNDFRYIQHSSTCSIKNCNRVYLAKGLCSMHYQRRLYNGDPIKTKRNPDGDGHINQGYQTFKINKKTIHEHRRVMEEHLGRKLLPFPKEVIHHIDGNKLNNHISNLMVMSASEHQKLHQKLRYH